MEFLQQNLLLVALVAVSGGALLWTSLQASAGGTRLNASKATLLINREDALVIDVRDTGDFIEGHLPGARNVPAASLEQKMAELVADKDRPVIVTCATGARTVNACKKLKAAGYTRVHELEGGLQAWMSAGLPVIKGKK